MGRLPFDKIERIAKLLVLSLAALAAILYCGDYVSIHYRIPGNRPQTGTVQVQSPYYAVKMKDGKTEFMFGDVPPETCARSLFPQLGYRPCWYAMRSPRQRIDIH